MKRTIQQDDIPDVLARDIAAAFIAGEWQRWRELEALADRLGYGARVRKVNRAMRAIREEQQERALLDDLLQDVDMSGLGEVAA